MAKKVEILRVREICTLKDMSIKDLEKSTGLSYVYLSQISRNEKFPRPEALLKIAAALDVDVRDLFVSTKEDKTNIELIDEIESITSKLKSRMTDAKLKAE